MVTLVTFFISSELLSMPAVKRFSVSFAKHPTNGTSASLQVYFHSLHLPLFCMSMENFFHFFCWFSFILLSRNFCHVSFDLSSFSVFLTIQQNLKPFTYTAQSLSVASCGQLSLSPSDSVSMRYGWLFVWMSLSTCLFPVIVCAQVCGKVVYNTAKKHVLNQYLCLTFNLGSKII